MKTNDDILISSKDLEDEKFKFQKFSVNTPLNCDNFFERGISRNALIPQSTVIVESESGQIKEFPLASVTIQKLFNKLSDKI